MLINKPHFKQQNLPFKEVFSFTKYFQSETLLAYILINHRHILLLQLGYFKTPQVG